MPGGGAAGSHLADRTAVTLPTLWADTLGLIGGGGRDIAVVAAPHDDLLRRFVSDLKRRGLPTSRVAHSEV